MQVTRGIKAQRALLHRHVINEALTWRDPLGMSSFPMIPYCGRIARAQFAFGGLDPLVGVAALLQAAATLAQLAWRITGFTLAEGTELPVGDDPATSVDAADTDSIDVEETIGGEGCRPTCPPKPCAKAEALA
mgnify:CR=1 FL=1